MAKYSQEVKDEKGRRYKYNYDTKRVELTGTDGKVKAQAEVDKEVWEDDQDSVVSDFSKKVEAMENKAHVQREGNQPMGNTYLLVWQEFDRMDQLVTRQRQFESKAARKAFVNKLKESKRFYKVKSLKEAKVNKPMKEAKLSQEQMATAIAEKYDEDEEIGEQIESFLKEEGYDWQENAPELGLDEYLTDHVDEWTVKEAYEEFVEGNGGSFISYERVLELMKEAFLENNAARVETFEEAGIMTKNKGLVVTYGNKSFQIQINGSY